mgnify:FL=1
MEVKTYLAEALNTFLDPIRARRAEFGKDRAGVLKLLHEGTDRGRTVAAETLTNVKKAMGIRYW